MGGECSRASRDGARELLRPPHWPRGRAEGAGRGRAEGAGLVAHLGGELGVAHGEPLRLGAQLLHERLGALGDGARLGTVLHAHGLLRGEQLLHLGTGAVVLLARV